ncbi:hypothetical protein D915_006128 [Fasciola hepatica]|uniref:Uncharacterized protein n=1 Tax=Fasciola hepatica TaxID=6192 RepID=A0A4E0R4A3_FASHE|nr:hypothetical protein D915_006128 [Fasciola hepatica]
MLDIGYMWMLRTQCSLCSQLLSRAQLSNCHWKASKRWIKLAFLCDVPMRNSYHIYNSIHLTWSCPDVHLF